MKPQGENGFTLIEVLLATAILALLVATGTPAFVSLLDRLRLQSAAETIADHLRYARSTAIKRNRPIYVSFYTNGASYWCYRISDTARCDCRIPTSHPSSRYRQTVTATDFPGVTLRNIRFGKNHYTRFDPKRGTARFGSLELALPRGATVQLKLSLLGRLRICSASTQQAIITGYPPC